MCKINTEDIDEYNLEHVEDIDIELELPIIQKDKNSQYSFTGSIGVYNINGKNSLYEINGIGAINNYIQKNFLNYEFELLTSNIYGLSDRIIKCETDENKICSGNFKSASVPVNLILKKKNKKSIHFKIFDTFFKYNLDDNIIKSTNECSYTSLAKFSHLYNKRIIE